MTCGGLHPYRLPNLTAIWNAIGHLVAHGDVFHRARGALKQDAPHVGTTGKAVPGSVNSKIADRDRASILHDQLGGDAVARVHVGHVRDQAAGGRQNHDRILGLVFDPFESKVFGNYHLFGVIAGANFDYGSRGRSIYRLLNGCELHGARAGTNGNSCGKGLSAKCNKRDQSQT